MSAVDIASSPIHIQSGFIHNKSIVIYLTISGSVIPMCILESDSIASVKLKIQTCKGFLVKKQKLVFEGKELSRNNCLVKDYGVSSGDVLHLILRVSNLLVITVETAFKKEFEFQVERFRTVRYLKQKISQLAKGFPFVNVDDQEILCNGEKLDDQNLIDDICKNHNGVVHLVVQKPQRKDLQIFKDSKTQKKSLLEPVFVNLDLKFSPVIQEMVMSALEGLKKGKKPIKSSEGTGGAYFLQHPNGKKYVAIFKPIDEEPMAVNNPRGLPLSTNGEGLKRGTKVGEGALREVAAYILDHPLTGPQSTKKEMGFSGVPPTIMVKCLNEEFNHPEGYDGSEKNVKIGSLQLFVKNCGSCEDMGPRDFPVDEVHKITVFDLRTASADRHAGNILMSREEDGRINLIPIDHGYCLPENFKDCTFDWLYWPQAREPYSQKTLDYINSLDVEEDIALLSSYGWDLSLECARTFRISTMLLKKGAKKGLSPFTIGKIMCRETLNKESVIEKIVERARDSMVPGMSEGLFLEMVSEIMDSELENVCV